MFTRHSVLLLKAVFFEDSDSDINALENTEHIVKIKQENEKLHEFRGNFN